LTEVDGTVVQG